MAQMTSEQWATALLKKIGAPTTPNNVQNIQRMIGVESSGNQAGFMRDNNPWNLNTYTSPHGSLPGGHIVNEWGIHVQVFNSVEDGLNAYENQLKSNPHLLSALHTNASPADFGTALSTSGWASGHYANATAFSALAPFTGSSTGASTNPASAGGAPVSNVQSLSAKPPAVAPPQIVGLSQTYAGPGAYKGFDLASLAPDLQAPARKAIDQYLSNPGLENTVLTDIYKNYGQESWAANNPEVRTLLVVGSVMGWDKDPAIFQAQLQRTKWWQSTSDNMRLWQETQANDPGQAAQAVAEASARVRDIANGLGVQLDPTTLQQIATTVAQQSVTGLGQFSNTNFTDQQIRTMVSGHFNSTQFLQSAQQTATGGTPGAATATSVGGDAAALYNQFQTISRNYYLNLTPQQIADRVQQYIGTDTGQGNFESGAIQGFTTMAQTMAKQMYPALASSLGTTSSSGLDNSPYASTAWARNMVAQYTGQGSGDNVNLMDPQWSWILSGKPAPATGNVAGLLTPDKGGNAPGTGNGSIPSADDLQRYLMSTPQFQKTDMAKNMGWQVGSSILKSFGYN